MNITELKKQRVAIKNHPILEQRDIRLGHLYNPQIDEVYQGLLPRFGTNDNEYKRLKTSELKEN